MAKHSHFLWADLFSENKRQSDLARKLSENVLFKTLSRRQLKYLSNFVYERTFDVDEEIFTQGERGIGMYLIVSGRIAIKTGSAQHEHLVTELREGSFLGELSLVDPQHLRTAKGVALERSVLIGFFKPDLEEILKRNSDIGVKIMFQLSTVLARRLVETTQLITRLREHPPTSGESRAKSA